MIRETPTLVSVGLSSQDLQVQIVVADHDVLDLFFVDSFEWPDVDQFMSEYCRIHAARYGIIPELFA